MTETTTTNICMSALLVPCHTKCQALIRFLMDEDALPTIPLCSAPPPLHLPPSSITPSCVNDGISGNRRSDCIQEISSQTPTNQEDATEEGARQKPTSHTQDAGNMVQVSESKHPRVEGSDGQPAGKQGGLDFAAAAKCQNKEGLERPNMTPPLFITENLERQLVCEEELVDADTDTPAVPCPRDVNLQELDTTVAAKGWVIGPLFQSLKSKMASFTEIVMSPAKLFRPTSPTSTQEGSPEKDLTEEKPVDDQSFWSPVGLDLGSERSLCSRKLAFDVDLSPSSDQPEAMEPKENSEPSPSPPPLISSDQVTSSEPFVSPGATEEGRPPIKLVLGDRQLKPLQRKCALSRSLQQGVDKSDLEVNFELRSQRCLVKQKSADSPSCHSQPTVVTVHEGDEFDGLHRPSLRKNKAGSVSALPNSKRTLKGSHEVTQRKRLKVDDAKTSVSEAPRRTKPQKKKVVSPDSTSGKAVKPENTSSRPKNKKDAPSCVTIPSQDESRDESEIKPRRGRQKNSGPCRSLTAGRDAEVELCVPSQLKVLNQMKPQKRKLLNQATSISTSVVEPNLISADPLKKVDDPKSEVSQTAKKPKKESRVAVKSCSGEGEVKSQKPVGGGLQRGGRPKVLSEPVYFEMTLLSDCHVTLRKNKEAPVASVSPDSSVTGVDRPNRQQGRSKKAGLKSTSADEQVSSSLTLDDVRLPSSKEGAFPSRLSRSFSCPEIPSLCSRDLPWTSLSQRRAQSSIQLQTPHSFVTPPTNKAVRRTRRHTVCSLEVEREIAPLCLRKEVYPSRRSIPYDKATQHLPPTLALSPTSSLSALASCFLSSPLAFISRKAESREGSCHMTSPTSSSTSSPLSSVWLLSGFLPRSDSGPSLDSNSSASPLETPVERRPQSEEDEGENTCSSSQEFEDAALREEKSLSDSEIKAVQTSKGRGKVSSIRIRKALPKPQNNLTPMGLPKTVRVKKKEFSLEEIYTNKNFSQPPESRLETIFEVPLSRRNGLESSFGQRRMKRFVEFPELGQVRKAKKPLVGVGKLGTSRTRRGGFAKDTPPVAAQDAESLLCAKLDQLRVWLTIDQTDS
ncbi:uncharacterized protein prr14 isoform X2 [Synchiropus splendidus]|uniref:uncharacterized protein prr14 isoform X2 n=1 Tax=Synchiropus splendidus TaxID=270530 RepID=UPI00237E3FE1|nr:uncharacterized protein prr14 isoform X2 [Synchiropus splendidus]